MPSAVSLPIPGLLPSSTDGMLNQQQSRRFRSARGHYVHGHYFNHIVRNLESFRTFQIIQHELRQLTLKLVKHPQYYQPEEEASLLSGIRSALGDEVEIAVSYVDEILPSGSGKMRYAIRECPLTLLENP